MRRLYYHMPATMCATLAAVAARRPALFAKSHSSHDILAASSNPRSSIVLGQPDWNFTPSRRKFAHPSVQPLSVVANLRSTAEPSKSASGSEGQIPATTADIEEAVGGSEVNVAIKFVSDDVLTMAKPGENLWAVAERCGVSIPLSCGRGDCGSCEMEVKKWNLDGSQAGTSVVRTCIAAVPPGYDRLEIDAMEDAIWGADGFDT